MTHAAISSWSETLVWVLTHSLWQGALISAAVWFALRWLPARRAERRYAVAVLGLAALVLSSFATWSVLRLEPASQPVRAGEIGADRHVAIVESSPEQGLAEPDRRHSPPTDSRDISETPADKTTLSRTWPIWLAGFWLAGAGGMLARTSAGLMLARGLSRANGGASGFDVRVLDGLVRELCPQLGLERTVRLVVSDRIRSPAVLGTLWPCVLIPAALLCGVPVEQWRIILAHELAHIRRHDALVNLIQLLVESLLFFNPAVWWLSRQIRVEREACCDALAAEVCGPPLLVARVLVEVAASLQGDARWSNGAGSDMSLRTPAAASLVAFAEPAHQGELTDRVHRLVEPDRAAQPSVSWLGLAVAMSTLFMAGAVLQQGTDLVVQAAAAFMSPKERVDRLAQLQAETKGVFLPPATSSSGEDTASVPGNKGVLDPRGTNAENLKVTLVIRTEDGSPLPTTLQISSLSATSNSSVSKALDGPRVELPEYRKTLTFVPCKLRFGATAKGFATAVSPLINLFEGDPERTIELVMKRGSQATLKFVDGQRQPIAGAELKTTALVSIGGSSTGHETRMLRADERGVITLDHVGEAEFDQEVRAPGFQRDHGRRLALRYALRASRVPGRSRPRRFPRLRSTPLCQQITWPLAPRAHRIRIQKQQFSIART